MPVRDYSTLTKRENASSKSFQIRLMESEDVPALMAIRRDLKIHDAASCVLSNLKIDPTAILVLKTDKGEVIGSCSAVRVNPDLCFVGLYCLREEYRGYGIGIEIWNACLEHVGHRNAALNAVPEKLEIYRDKGGFSLQETEFTITKNYTTEPVNPKTLSNILPKGTTIHSFQRKFLPAMLKYDFELIGYKRELALALSCTERDSRTFVAFKNGACVGFGSIKTTCLDAGRVGPLYADDPKVAEVLLRNLVLSLPNVKCFAMMSVSTNIPAHRMLKKLGCPKVEELTRLYTKEKVSVNTSKIFAMMDVVFQPF